MKALMQVLVLAWLCSVALPLPAQTRQGVRLEADCVAELRDHDERLRTAGAARSLLAWTPLLVMQGEGVPLHLAYTVATMPWLELANGLGNVNRLVSYELATAALNHSARHEDNPELRLFWRRLAEVYAAKAR